MTVQALRERRIETLAQLLDAHGRELQAVAYLILRDQALRNVEEAERTHVAAINPLEKVASPKLDEPTTQLLVS